MSIDSNLIILITVAGLNFALAIWVLRHDKKQKANFIFSLLIFFVIVWSVTNYLAEILNNQIVALFFLRLTYVVPIIIVILFLKFSLIFPREIYKISNLISFLIYSISALFILLSFSSLMIKEIEIAEPFNSMKSGPLSPAFTVYFLVIMSLGFLILIKKYKNLSTIEKVQLKYVFFGAILSTLGASLTNLVIPLVTGSWTISRYGPYFMFFVTGFTTYAILKHHLFNIKVIATEFLVGLVTIVLLVDTLLSKTLLAGLVKLGILVAFSYLGISLIRSVLEEIKRREEIEKMSFKLQRAYQELKKLDEAKSEFIAMASHQLRTPLTIIKGLISMMNEGSYGRPPEKFKKPLGDVFSSNERLIRIVNDLLDMSKIELGKMELSKEKVQIEDLVREVLKEYKNEAQKKNIYLKLDKPEELLPELNIDSLKIRQVIVCVIDNAIKYTQKGGITIKIKSPAFASAFVKTSAFGRRSRLRPTESAGKKATAGRQKSKIKIEIQDTGAGMEKEEIEKIFASFVRGKAGINLWIQGAGLGLYLAKKYVELHNGRIWAESAGKGRGSTFHIELPLK